MNIKLERSSKSERCITWVHWKIELRSVLECIKQTLTCQDFEHSKFYKLFMYIFLKHFS